MMFVQTMTGIPALFGIDTRRLTKRIRESGSILGKIEFVDQPITMRDPNVDNLVAMVSTKVRVLPVVQNSSLTSPAESQEIRSFNEEQQPHIVAFDCGIKLNIIRHFIYTHVGRLLHCLDFPIAHHCP